MGEGPPNRVRLPNAIEMTQVTPPSTKVAIGKRPFLVVLSGPEATNLYDLSEGAELVIGREDGLTMRITDDGISRRHARVVREDDGVYLEDLGSRNGVFVRNARVQRERLNPGDVFQVGATTTIQFNLGTELDIQYQRRLAEAAHRDPLTGVHNRRHFNDLLPTSVSAARRHGRPMTLIVVDVDHFKKVNDTHGHAAGDAVLRVVARTLSENLRAEDALSRFGGEEFVIVSRETDAVGARVFAERLREAVEAASCAWEGGEIRVTASLGVAEIEAGMTPEQLFEAADHAVYEAKRAGRNRVSIAGETKVT